LPTTRQQAASSHGGTRGASTASVRKRDTGTSRHGAAAAAATSSADASTAPAAGAATAQDDGAPSSTATATGAPEYELVSAKGAGGEAGDTRPVGVGILVAVFAAAGLAFMFGFGRRGVRTSSR
jgi:cobalamin biosynthesis Mg chelatase CobN